MVEVLVISPVKKEPNQPPESAGGFLGHLRAAANIALVAGAVGSLGFMLKVGQHNQSLILLVLFTVWVLSPFVALALAGMVSKKWSVPTRTTLYCVILVLSLVSLTIYGYVALSPPRSQPAFFFLVVPFGSWLLGTMAVALAALLFRRLAKRRPGP